MGRALPGTVQLVCSDMISGKKLALFILVPFLLLTVLTAAAFLYVSQEPSGTAYAALESGNYCRVAETYVPSWRNRYYAFTPNKTDPSDGLIMYPGGLIDVRCYAPLAQALAERGCLVVLVSMPLNISLLGWSRASGIQAAYPDIMRWFVGGHSLGGVAACKYARSFPAKVSGVFLLASHPSAGLSLRDSGLQCISVFSDQDGLVPPDKIKQCAQYLPDNTAYLCIKGGNHSNFADIDRSTPYPGDKPARIPRHLQHLETARAIVRFLEPEANDSK